VVEIRSLSTSGEGNGEAHWRKKTRLVDLSAILNYVSPRELERFENERYKEEAELEAIVRRAEAEEKTRKRLEKNARASGVGKPMSGESATPGRPSGRGRGQRHGDRSELPTTRRHG
jgi:hypothetical protein